MCFMTVAQLLEAENEEKFCTQCDNVDVGRTKKMMRSPRSSLAKCVIHSSSAHFPPAHSKITFFPIVWRNGAKKECVCELTSSGEMMSC